MMPSFPWLLLLLLTGCVPRGYDMRSISPKHNPYYGTGAGQKSVVSGQWSVVSTNSLTTAQRDALMAAYSERHDPRFGGLLAARDALSAPAAALMVYVKFTAPKEFDGFNLYGGTNENRSDWKLLASTTGTTFPVQTKVPGRGVFGVRAFLRNGIDGAQTESDWGRVTLLR